MDMNKPFKQMTPEEKRQLLKVLHKMEREGKVKIGVNDEGETVVTLVKKP